MLRRQWARLQRWGWALALVFFISFVSYITTDTSNNNRNISSIHAALTNQKIEITNKLTSEDMVVNSKDTNNIGLISAQDVGLNHNSDAILDKKYLNTIVAENAGSSAVNEFGDNLAVELKRGSSVVNDFGDNVGLELELHRQRDSTELKYILHWNEAYGSKGRKSIKKIYNGIFNFL